MKAGKLNYHLAAGLDDAIALNLAHDGMAKYMAGGQSLMPMMNLRLASSEEIIDITRIPELGQSRAMGEHFFMGAGITHAMIEDGKVHDPAQGYLQHVAHGIAYRSIRNKGTLGGSLAHADPAADWPTALLALGAVAVIKRPGGDVQIPLENFQLGLMETCLGEADLLMGVLLPQLSTSARWSYVKFCHKVGEFAHSIGAVVLDTTQGLANAVLGAAGDKPVLLPRLSAKLSQGMRLSELTTDAFTALLEQDIAEQTSHDKSSYDFHLHKTMITRAVTEALKK